MKKLFEFILKMLARMLTYSDYAEVILSVSRMFFNQVTEFIESLVEEYQEGIDEAKDQGQPDEVIDEMKREAAEAVDASVVAKFSASPTWVPGFVRRAIRDAKAYLVNHHDSDIRNDRAREHGFFKEHDQKELKDVVDSLNKGFIDR